MQGLSERTPGCLLRLQRTAWSLETSYIPCPRKRRQGRQSSPAQLCACAGLCALIAATALDVPVAHHQPGTLHTFTCLVNGHEQQSSPVARPVRHKYTLTCLGCTISHQEPWRACLSLCQKRVQYDSPTVRLTCTHLAAGAQQQHSPEVVERRNAGQLSWGPSGHVGGLGHTPGNAWSGDALRVCVCVFCGRRVLLLHAFGTRPVPQTPTACLSRDSYACGGHEHGVM